MNLTVLGIRDILVRIRMRTLGSVPSDKNIKILRNRIQVRMRNTGTFISFFYLDLLPWQWKICFLYSLCANRMKSKF